MPAPRFDLIEDRRAIVDRRVVADRIAAAPDLVGAVLGEALAHGRGVIAARLMAAPSRGRMAAASYAFLADQLVRLAFDSAAARIGGTIAGRIALVGLGGTGRGEMAPHSDVDLMFLVRLEDAGEAAPLVEATLYALWDLKLKIGHAVRTPDDLIALAKSDMSIRTAMLEARWIWGDAGLFDAANARFRKQVVTGSGVGAGSGGAGSGRAFVAAKLAERDERHIRSGDSRYLVEPNVKDGKGGLRDLHTLYWIANHLFGIERPEDMVERGLLSAAEFRRFERAERFFWSVRCHLHLAAGRGEDRLGFDNQPAIARALRYAERPGKSAVERFMQFYFLQAKAVGDLTGIFLAQLDERMGREGRRFALPTFRRRPAKLHGFSLDRGRLSIPDESFLAADPVRLVELFALAARERLEIHPKAMRAATRDSRAVDSVRDDPAANALFLEVLTAIANPDLVLRWMNEAGVFGRFVPDFGRVVAQMQFDMYHHYTVDEHSIRAIGLLAKIERGELAEDHPLSTALFRQLGSRRVLYVAVLLHDIAKGRKGDHSVLGEEVAQALGPRFGLDPAETETVAWLVRNHLLMSATAFKRDLADPKTIVDFVGKVQSPERLRLLLMLTVVDIRAVGPGTWNQWKRQLLRTLYDAAEERLRLGHKQRGRSEQVAARQAQLAADLGWSAAAAKAHARRLPDSYWLAEPKGWQLANARQIAAAESRIGEMVPSVVAAEEPGSGATRISVFAPDRPGLFYRVAAALAGAEASIIDARIHTSRDGMAIDNLLVQDSQRRPYTDRKHRGRLVKAIEQALVTDELPPPPPTQPLPRRRAAFAVAPSVVIAERASTRTTVVEVNARDQNGLLARLALAIHELGHQIHSAHIATYGERAVDTFYLTNGAGRKLSVGQIAELRNALSAATSPAERPSKAA
ncbi:MAG: [protein-PII] uridylyltransferase [Sphingomonas bacterium]|nr:[protein-PII] uridylyltransferase [Sphingomonas bacterium]